MISSNLQKDWNVPPDIPNVFEAAASNNVKELEIALEYHDVNERDESGMTPLHHASATLSFDTAERLLKEVGVNTAIQDNNGREAAIMAEETFGFGSQEAVMMRELIWPPAQEDVELNDPGCDP